MAWFVRAQTDNAHYTQLNFILPVILGGPSLSRKTGRAAKKPRLLPDPVDIHIFYLTSQLHYKGLTRGQTAQNKKVIAYTQPFGGFATDMERRTIAVPAPPVSGEIVRVEFTEDYIGPCTCPLFCVITESDQDPHDYLNHLAISFGVLVLP
jgi:hypothetical protein